MVEKFILPSVNHRILGGLYLSDLPGKGLHPECDPWGCSFSETYHPNRAQKANTRIAGRFHMVLDGVQGDADFIAAIFKLKRFMAGIFESGLVTLTHGPIYFGFCSVIP